MTNYSEDLTYLINKASFTLAMINIINLAQTHTKLLPIIDEIPHYLVPSDFHIDLRLEAFYKNLTEKYSPDLALLLYAKVYEFRDHPEGIDAIRNPELIEEIKNNITNDIDNWNNINQNFITNYQNTTLIDKDIMALIADPQNLQLSRYISYVVSKIQCFMRIVKTTEEMVEEFQYDAQNITASDNLLDEKVFAFAKDFNICNQAYPLTTILDPMIYGTFLEQIIPVLKNFAENFYNEPQNKQELTKIIGKLVCLNALYSEAENVINAVKEAEIQDIASKKLALSYQAINIYYPQAITKAQECHEHLIEETLINDGLSYFISHIKNQMKEAHDIAENINSSFLGEHQDLQDQSLS